MRPLSTLALLGPLFVAAIACTAQGVGSEEEGESVNTVSAALGTAGCPSCKFVLPEPGSKENAIPPAEKAAIIAEWTQSAKDYYPVAGTTAAQGYAGYKAADGKIVMGAPPVGIAPAYAEIKSCEGNCPAYYSDLVCHFYSHMPSYNQVIPNVRGCFSNLARGGIPGSTSRLYPDIWDYCMYQDYDAVKNAAQPAWDLAQITKKEEKGVLRHLAPSLRPVFQYIMYTSYQPFTYKLADQMEIITGVYTNLGQPVPAPLAGRAPNPNDAPAAGAPPGAGGAITNAMKAYFAAHNPTRELSGAGKAGTAPTAPSTATPSASGDAICKSMVLTTTPAASAKANCGTCCQISHKADGAAAPANTAACTAACPP